MCVELFFFYVSLGKSSGCGCCIKQRSATRQRLDVCRTWINPALLHPVFVNLYIWGQLLCRNGDNYYSFFLHLKKGRSTEKSGISHRTLISGSFAQFCIADASSYFSCFGYKRGKKKEMRKKAKSLPLVFKELTIYINRQQVNSWL